MRRRYKNSLPISRRNFLLRTGAFDDDATPLQRVDEIINDLTEIDPNGETFRYPTNRTGDYHLQEWKLINLAVLLERIEFIESFFSWCDCMADGIWEARVHTMPY